jgi:glycosyltransferase involved in cell wall biosynthesis
MKISLITTVYNEEKTIERFLTSVFAQTQLPDEVIIVDGGSIDQTVATIKKVKEKCKVFIKKGNRSVGRNEAIRHATGDIIVCSDAGNVLDKKWIEEITKIFGVRGNDKENRKNDKVDVVAGYYQGSAKNVFQKCLIPYALVMADRIDPHNFLPATRSVAFTKTIWEKVGGFDERFSHNEDYVFAKELKKIGAKIFFQKKALVYWFPRETFKQAFIMFWRFAYGDAEANILRPKVVFLFVRYSIALFFFIWLIISPSLFFLTSYVLFFIFYFLWAVAKNYRYVNAWQAIYYLPLLQLTADFAVLIGTVMGVKKSINGVL